MNGTPLLNSACYCFNTPFCLQSAIIRKYVLGDKTYKKYFHRQNRKFTQQGILNNAIQIIMRIKISIQQRAKSTHKRILCTCTTRVYASLRVASSVPLSSQTLQPSGESSLKLNLNLNNRKLLKIKQREINKNKFI